VSGVALDRRPDYDRELRFRALSIYRKHLSYRKAGEEMGLSHKRVHILVREALRLEMDEARG
jgi:DNA-directed RNA polymerase specialized sigma24 family protein